MLGIELGTLCMLDRHSISWAASAPAGLHLHQLGCICTSWAVAAPAGLYLHRLGYICTGWLYLRPLSVLSADRISCLVPSALELPCIPVALLLPQPSEYWNHRPRARHPVQRNYLHSSCDFFHELGLSWAHFKVSEPKFLLSIFSSNFVSGQT